MLGIIVATLFIALVANIFLKKFALPTLIGYILTGTIISYLFGLHDAVNNHELKEIAEFGVVFLMFTIGLEFSFKHLKEMKYEVLVVGSLQILITSLVIFLIAFYIFDLAKYSAFIISMAVAMSSTAIVLKTFNETGEINKQYGKNALGILIMQDIAVIPVLIIIGILASSETSIRSVISEIILGVVILMAALYVIGRYLLEPFFTQIIKTHSDELFIGSILFLAIGASYGAHLLGFSYSLGAFIAGMLISETKYKHQAEADLIPFRDILLGVFFITVGMQIKFGIIFEYAFLILFLLLLIMVVKFFIIYFIVKFGKNNNRRTTLKTAFSLLQVGEFSLVILELARAHSLVEAPYGQVMIIVIVISMIMTPFILSNLSRLTDMFIKELEAKPDDTKFFSTEISEHVVVLGYGEFGQNLSTKLKADGQFYIVIENNADRYELAVKNKEPVIYGNAANREILKKSYLTKAKKVVIAIDNEKKLHLVCQIVQKLVHNDKVIVKVHSIKERAYLQELGLQHIIVENEETSRAILNYI
ncbi:sodium:proton exchanger [Sulfurimonas aquatica]|uniref:Sodium:proton exchanger n=1 Tax=Sulfurimonas aquatica TaxID=2672570 RepID=A0A975B297_9BACT|nr:cation:proton antiporter [Sulfurimonas aquatica]QSZ42912.1 sodium:proton exchanger [Sulfurimonas aquatica]